MNSIDALDIERARARDNNGLVVSTKAVIASTLNHADAIYYKV